MGLGGLLGLFLALGGLGGPLAPLPSWLGARRLVLLPDRKPIIRCDEAGHLDLPPLPLLGPTGALQLPVLNGGQHGLADFLLLLIQGLSVKLDHSAALLGLSSCHRLLHLSWVDPILAQRLPQDAIHHA